MLMHALIHWLRQHHHRNPSGQGMVEYALILIFVAVVMILIITILAPGVGNIYSNIVETLNNGLD